MSAADLQALAVEYLDVCVIALDAGVPGGAPARRFVANGPPVWDCCPQLTVHVGGPAVAETAVTRGALGAGHRVTTTGFVNMVSLTATVLRCAPVLDGNALPSPDSLQDAAATMNADLWAIWNTVSTRKRADLLFAPRERELMMDPASALNQQGGCCGWQIPIRVQLDGYRPEVMA